MSCPWPPTADAGLKASPVLTYVAMQHMLSPSESSDTLLLSESLNDQVKSSDDSIIDDEMTDEEQLIRGSVEDNLYYHGLDDVQGTSDESHQPFSTVPSSVYDPNRRPCKSILKARSYEIMASCDDTQHDMEDSNASDHSQLAVEHPIVSKKSVSFSDCTENHELLPRPTIFFPLSNDNSNNPITTTNSLLLCPAVSSSVMLSFDPTCDHNPMVKDSNMIKTSLSSSTLASTDHVTSTIRGGSHEEIDNGHSGNQKHAVLLCPYAAHCPPSRHTLSFLPTISPTRSYLPHQLVNHDLTVSNKSVDQPNYHRPTSEMEPLITSRDDAPSSSPVNSTSTHSFAEPQLVYDPKYDSNACISL